jgi:hypothetical protein
MKTTFTNEEYKELLEEIQQEHQNLSLVQTNGQYDGNWCKNVRLALVGFDSVEQAKQVADEYGLEMWYLNRKDGHDFYNREGEDYNQQGFEISAESFGCDFEMFTSAEEYWGGIRDIISDEEMDFWCAMDFMKNAENVYNEIDMLDENQVVITHEGRYFGTFSKFETSYSEDNNNHIIGVLGFSL